MCILDVSCKNYKTGGKGKMKRSKKISNKALRAVERIARVEVEKVRYEWPPLCIGIGHQPKRPKMKEE